jgi:hypothetical protein
MQSPLSCPDKAAGALGLDNFLAILLPMEYFFLIIIDVLS